jgi:hypothetical protein
VETRILRQRSCLMDFIHLFSSNLRNTFEMIRILTTDRP